MSKLMLGTVQFGMNYGINNPKGKIGEDEVFEILKEAENSGIDILDTAPGYGNSESLIGKYMSGKKDSFRIVTKLPKCAPKDVQRLFNNSLNELGQKSVYGLLLHDFQAYIDAPEIWNELVNLKRAGKVQKIGFSLYYTFRLEKILDDGIPFDIVQLPYNLFDTRFGKYFKKLKNLSIEIHARSPFLQGATFIKPSQLKGNMVKLKNKIIELRRISKESDLSIAQICVGFVALNSMIDKVVFGVDCLDNLFEILKFGKNERKIKYLYEKLLDLSVDDESIVVPLEWVDRADRRGRTVAIIQARMGSSRLPGKVLMDIFGKSVLERVVQQVTSAKLIDDVVIATTENSADDKIVSLCEKLGVKVFRGSENDVLERYMRAAEKFGAENIVRITADCPLIDPLIIDKTIETYVNEHSNYASSRLDGKLPSGQDVEVISRDSLRKAWESAKMPYDREHVTPYIKKHPEMFNLTKVKFPYKKLRTKISLDTGEDYALIMKIYDKLSKKKKWGFKEIKEILIR